MTPREDIIFVRKVDDSNYTPVWLEILGHVFNKIIYILGLFAFVCLLGKAVGLLP